MKKIIFLSLFIIFLNAENYVEIHKLVLINDKFVELINKMKKQDRFDFVFINRKYSPLALLNGYKNQKTTQRYFNYLKNQDRILTLFMYDEKTLKEIDKKSKNIKIIKNLQNEINNLNKVNLKHLFKVMRDALDVEIYIITHYNLKPHYIVAQKGNEKIDILSTLKGIKKYLKY